MKWYVEYQMDNKLAEKNQIVRFTLICFLTLQRTIFTSQFILTKRLSITLPLHLGFFTK